MQIIQAIWIGMLLLFLNPGTLWAVDGETAAAEPVDSEIHWGASPIFFSTPETGMAIGGYIMGYRSLDPDSPAGKQDSFDGMLIYTKEEQIICNLSLKKYFQGDRYLLMAKGGYLDFPSKFYGIGSDADEDMEEDYTLLGRSYSASFLYKMVPDFYLGPFVSYGVFDVKDRTAGGQLAAGNIIGWDGTTVAGAGFQLLRDTRDDNYMPRNGSVFNAQAISYRQKWGSDEDFSQYGVTYKCFWPVGQTGTFALMSLVLFNDGTVPFEMMPCLGGETIMRGYYSGLYRDRDYAALQGEYRYVINSRISGVYFASLGEVAPESRQFNGENIKAAAGFGFRFQLYPKQKLRLRLDIGVSEDGFATYINFMEAF
ncbi:MAG TPA: hypothetical protein DDW65_12765 [Firmicutes bacterium]|nr:hypothetical protein [Bacillota bacterium]